MSMVGFKVAVAVGSITQLTSTSTVLTGRCSIQNLGAGTVFILPSTTGAPATAADISNNGFQVTAGNPFQIDDPAGTPQPDLSMYYATATGLVAGDLRVAS